MPTYKVFVKGATLGYNTFSIENEKEGLSALRIHPLGFDGSDWYNEWKIADFTTTSNLEENFLSEYPRFLGIFGRVENIRDVDGISVFEMFKDKYSPLSFIPRVLRTVGFVAYIRANYPELYVDRATVMWGSQFNILYPGKKKRVFAETRYHNGHMWEEGLNLCNDYNPNIDCGNGLYFVEADDISRWLTYRWGITLKSTVYIPVDALVTVIISEVSGEIKFKTDKIVVKKFKQI